MVTGCVSSRWVPECEGEDRCGFYGLPHVLCVPVPPYAQASEASPEARFEEPATAPFGPAPALHADS